MNHLLTIEKNNKNKRFDKHNSLKKIPDKQIARFLLRSCHPHYYCIHRRFDSFLQKKNVRIVSIWHTVTWIIQTISKAFTNKDRPSNLFIRRIMLNLCVPGKERWSSNFNPPGLPVVYFLHFHCDILVKMVLI